MGTTQPYQSPRGQAHRDQVDGHWPSGEDDEDLVIEQNDENPPQPQTAAASTAQKEDKKSEPLDLDGAKPAKPERPTVEKPKEDTKNPEDAKKTKIDEDLAKKTKEDADKKKAAEDLLAQQKAAANVAAKAEAKRQDDLNKHPTQPIYMLTQAGVQMMKDNLELGRNEKVIYIPGLYYESMEVILSEVCRIVKAQCGIEDVTYTNNGVTDKVSFEWKKWTLKFLSFDKYFFDQLGMITQQVEMSSKPIYFSH